MGLLRSPVTQFLLAASVIVGLVAFATIRLSDVAALEEAIDDAVATTEVLARSVAEPAVPRGLVDGDVGAVDRFDRTALSRLLVDDVQRIKIWDAEGTIVYSDQSRLINQRYDLGEDELAVLAGGSPDAEKSDLDRPENRFEVGSGGLLEVYTRIISPEGEPLLFEVYFSATDIAARQREVLAAFRPITVGGLLALVVLTTPLMWVLTRRLDRTARDRERLLRSAVEASDGERRRIARDLHDTVVQDLAGTAFTLSALARGGGAAPADLEGSAGSLRGSLRSLRSLLVEIQPPDLRSRGLRAALLDLAAASGSGVEATVTTTGLDHVPDETTGLVWRVAQEAVRNALRHGRPTSLEVEVCGEPGGATRLRVTDDGVGFDPRAIDDPTHFGLWGMRGLAEDAGGGLDVHSAPGAGTTVELHLGTAAGATPAAAGGRL